MKRANRSDLNGPPLSVTTTTGRISPVVVSVSVCSRLAPASACASAMASSTAAMASCWLAVVEMCQPNSYLDQ